jgi:hypothetical protein
VSHGESYRLSQSGAQQVREPSNARTSEQGHTVNQLAPITHGTEIARPDAIPPAVVRIRLGWLLRCKSANTREAYTRDIARWFAFLADHDIDPLTVTGDHVSAYMRICEHQHDPRTGKPISPATVGRRVAVVSSFYRHAKRSKAIAENPAEHVDRPELDPDHSETVGLTADEAQRLIRAAEQIAGRPQPNGPAVQQCETPRWSSSCSAPVAASRRSRPPRSRTWVTTVATGCCS